MVNHEKLLDTLQRCAFLLSGKIGKTIDENIDFIDGNFSRGDDIPNEHDVVDAEVSEQLNNTELEPYILKTQCDACHGSFEYKSIYHFSGFLNHNFKKHWHVCPKCLNELKLKNNLIDVTTGAK